MKKEKNYKILSFVPIMSIGRLIMLSVKLIFPNYSFFFLQDLEISTLWLILGVQKSSEL